MPQLGAPELLIIFSIIVVLFGAGRVADLGGALGRGIREFRRALREEEPESDTASDGDDGRTSDLG
ncbi:MAG: twin-arginine translocase TatA/TatE family subunit [Armatimonadota bacterium]